MSQTVQEAPLVQTDSSADEISLIELATTLGHQKKWVLGLPAVVAVVAAAVSFYLPPVYVAETTVLPPSGNGGGGGAVAALASLGGALGGLGGGFGVQTPDEQYVAMLKSRSVRTTVMQRFNLKERYGAKLDGDVFGRLEQQVEISSDKKTGLIRIQVSDREPKFAADLANGYVKALADVLDRVAVTDAQQRRLFFEKQFVHARDGLADAEVAMKKLQEKTGVVQIEGQAKATIEAVANLRAEIAKREVELMALRTFATAEHPDYRRVLGELQGLRVQLSKMEKGSKDDQGLLTSKELPETGLEYVRALRNVKYNEAVYEIMAKQFELAKIDEAKEGATLQQLDAAVPPERKAKPRRSVIVIVSTMAAVLLGILIALFKGAFERSAQIPENRRKLSAFKHAWKFKK